MSRQVNNINNINRERAVLIRGGYCPDCYKELTECTCYKNNLMAACSAATRPGLNIVRVIASLDQDLDY